MRQVAKSIPVDSTIEFLEARDYIKSNSDGTYSWNFNMQTGAFFSYKECLHEYMKHFRLKYKAQAYRSIKEALHELDLDIQHPKTWNIAMDERKHRSITTEFGKWFTANYGTCSGREQRKLYCRLYMQLRAGKLKIQQQQNCNSLD